MVKNLSNIWNFIILAVLALVMLVGISAAAGTGNPASQVGSTLPGTSEKNTRGDGLPEPEPETTIKPSTAPAAEPVLEHPEAAAPPAVPISGDDMKPVPGTTIPAPAQNNVTSPSLSSNPGASATQAPAASNSPVPPSPPAPTTTATPKPSPSQSPSPSPTPTTTPPTSPVPAPSGKVILGYYAGWAAYSGYKPSQIPATRLTHINYAFAKIGSDLKIALGDPAVDPGNLSALVKLKNVNPNLKILISVGGWNDSGRFSDAALTDASRTAFADSVVAFIKKYGLDGVDIDWEYPVSGGLATNTRRPEDKQNYTVLLAKLREKLTQQGAKDGRHYWLTAAGSAGSSYAKNVELSKIHQYLDYALVMTYDINGPWDAFTGFNAPLYASDGPTAYYRWSVDSAINMYLSSGFPASKLVMGIPFYGYVFRGVAPANNGLYQAFASGASASYDSIQSQYAANPAFAAYNSDAVAPWLFGGDTFISYDNAESITRKAQYIKTRKLAGAGIWELSQNRNGTLLDIIHQNLR